MQQQIEEKSLKPLDKTSGICYNIKAVSERRKPRAGKKVFQKTFEKPLDRERKV